MGKNFNEIYPEIKQILSDNEISLKTWEEIKEYIDEVYREYSMETILKTRMTHEVWAERLTRYILG